MSFPHYCELGETLGPIVNWGKDESYSLCCPVIVVALLILAAAGQLCPANMTAYTSGVVSLYFKKNKTSFLVFKQLFSKIKLTMRSPTEFLLLNF